MSCSKELINTADLASGRRSPPPRSMRPLSMSPFRALISQVSAPETNSEITPPSVAGDTVSLLASCSSLLAQLCIRRAAPPSSKVSTHCLFGCARVTHLAGSRRTA